MPKNTDGRRPDSIPEAVRLSPDLAFFLTPVHDAAGTIVELTYEFLNDAALNLYRMSSEDVVGHGLLELFPSSRDNGIFDADVRAIETQGRVDLVVPWVDENRVRGAFTMRATPHEDGVLVTALDVTAEMLAETHQRYRMIAEAASDIVCTLGADGDVDWVSPSVSEVLGWQREDIVGAPLLDLVHPDDLTAIDLQQTAGEADRADPGRVEIRVATPDGDWCWMSVSSRIIRDERGGAIAAIKTLRNVHSEVEARTALERTVRDLRSAQRMARLANWTWDPATDRVEWSNELLEMFGMEPDAAPPNFAQQEQLYGAESLRRLRAAVAETTRSGQPYDLEIEFIRVDSRRGWMRSWAEPVRDKNGVIVQIRGYAQDVTEQVEARRTLERGGHTLRETQRMARLGSWEWDIPEDRVEWSDELFEIFGTDRAHQPQSFSDHEKFYTPDSWKLLVEEVADTATTGDPYLLELEIIRGDSTRRWAQVRGEAIRDERGDIVGRRGFILDITERKQAERALAASETLFRTAMLASPIGMAMTELDGSFLVVNESLRELLGRDEAWFTSHTIDDVTHPDDATRLQRDRVAVVGGRTVTESAPVRLIRSDDQMLWVKRAAELIPGTLDSPDHLLVQYVDTTAEHEAVEALAFQAFHDPLTGLHNRAAIMDQLEADLSAASPTGRPVGVLFIDLDHFKVVNDSLGHAAGDEVLMTVADRISGVLRRTDRVGRSGGDEFIVVIPDAPDARHTERVAKQIVSTVGTELMIRGHRIVPTASIGIAMSNSDSTSATLLRDADAALFRAKAAGRSQWQFFDDAMHAEALGRLTIEGEIRHGLDADEFVVHYQPIVTLADRRVVGHEALVRWEHPTRGLLTPFHFLPTAEESGLIVDIGASVLDQVCALLEANPDLPGPISVNFSPVQLARSGWLQAFTDTFERHGVDPRRIIVEVTETAVMTLLPGTQAELVALRDLGVDIHVDDFGTGFSSISLLRDMPVTGLKLDRSFVADLSEHHDAAHALSTGLAGLVSGLHLMGIAEGVESEEQHQILLGHGWVQAQGYLYGRPAPRPALTVQIR